MTETQCSVCGAKLRNEPIEFTQQLGEVVYLVTDVPADVCPVCGEQYLLPETVDELQRLIKSRKTKETIQVPVYHFPHA